MSFILSLVTGGDLLIDCDVRDVRQLTTQPGNPPKARLSHFPSSSPAFGLALLTFEGLAYEGCILQRLQPLNWDTARHTCYLS